MEKVVEVTLPLTRRAKPEYKGNAHVQLRVDFARGNGWSGIATVNGREITGPYGTQSKVPGLIVPAGTGRGEWEWNLKSTNESLQTLVEGEETTEEILSRINGEIRDLYLAMSNNWGNEQHWRELFSASQALQWAVDTGMCPPSKAILSLRSPLSHYVTGANV